VIARSPQRHEKSLWTERTDGQRVTLQACADDRDQADAVCRAVLAARERGTPLKEQAVLFRAAHHSDVLEVELLRRNIPFVKYGGLKFLEAAHVKDALAILRVLENPHDEVAWFRVLQLPEGMGPAGARKVMDTIGVRVEGASPLVNLIDQPLEVPRGAAEGIQALRSALAGCADEAVLPPGAQLERLRAYLEPIVTERYDAPAPRLADLDQLALMARGYESRSRFLAELTLDPPASTSDLAGPPMLDEDYLILSTIHSAKGLEWDTVHVIHATDGCIPSDMATGDDDELEEERRLLYVALTRARDELTITYPQRYYRRQRPRDDVHMYAVVSRFLDEPSVLAHLEVREPAIDVRDDRAEAVAGTASVDAYLADLFG
jgi:DNA helicase-2/ATP-dependent DNA helicase PcrA